jgi:hypothetical protein
MFCHQCGKEVLEGARFCSSCGTSLTSGQAPAVPAGPTGGPLAAPAPSPAEGFVLLVCLGFGIVLFIGSGFAELQVGEERQFLGVTIYNFLLGIGFITSAVLFMLRHRRAPYLARIVALVYIGCTVVNEVVQLAHGQDMFQRHMHLTPQRSAWDIVFWSFFPAWVLVLSHYIIRRGARTAASKETSP